MLKALTVSEAKPRLGALLDQVSRGREVYFRRKQRLYRVEEVTEIAPIPHRPVGFFSFDSSDELTALADRAAVSFPPPPGAERPRTMPIEQWDIVRFRMRPEDRDLHPAVVISPPEWCANEARSRVNVLACSQRVPAEGVKAHQVVLDAADGLDFPPVCSCEFFHSAYRATVGEKLGRVSLPRRRAIGRLLNEVLRWPLG